MMVPQCTCELRVYDVVWTDTGEHEPSIRFNVKLVKCRQCRAAPDLLAACKRALPIVESYNATLETADVLKAAIKKAEAQS